MVYSGGKSIHAIVHIDANDYSEYRNRVDFLYQIVQKNGFKVDKQNKTLAGYHVCQVLCVPVNRNS